MKKIVKKVASRTLKGGLYEKVVLPKHYGVAVAANIKRGFPAKNLKVIAVTGTNGKTSTCYMIHSILRAAGLNAGLMTTVAYGVNDNIKPQMAHMTTQSVQLVLARIMDMKEEGMDYLVLEVTSQALAQFRILGVPIDIAVMTNITHEHLDYHGTFENYLKAKLKLFKLANRHKSGRQLGIINADDPLAKRFAGVIKNKAFYSLTGTPKMAVTPKKLKMTPQGSKFELEVHGEKYDITVNIPGSFNVSNAMAAILVAQALGLDKTQIERGISALEGVEGRMTRINEGQSFDVIVDFAHTPDSFDKLFSDIKPVVKGRLIALFGSAGRRDEAKRSAQGEIAGMYSDIIVLTEEDDRDIDGNQILDEIEAGINKVQEVSPTKVYKVLDRTQAIKKAISLAKTGDTLILLGKGHEKTIERADGEHPWDEIGTTKKLLKSR